MNAPELLTELARDGVRLWANGDRLSYEGPPDVLTPEVLEVMKASKRELMALLCVPEVEGVPEDVLQRARAALPSGVPQVEVEELAQAIAQADQEEAAWRAMGSPRTFTDELDTGAAYRQAHGDREGNR